MELRSSLHPIRVLSDHKNLEYFMSTKLLSCHRAHWSEFLSQFNFRIIYWPGKAGRKPDALTRWSGDLPKEGDECTAFQCQVVLKPHNLIDIPGALTLACGQVAGEPAVVAEEPAMVAEEPAVVAEEPAAVAEEPALPAEDPAGAAEKSIEELFNEAYTKDPIPDDVLGQLHSGQSRSKQLSLTECQQDGNGRLLYRWRLYVPNHMPLKLRLIKDFHEVPAAGHPGQSKTLKLLLRQYYWPRRHKDVD